MRIFKLSAVVTAFLSTFSVYATTTTASLGSLGTYSLLTVPTSAGTSTFGTGINDYGTIIGYSQNGAGVQTSFIYSNGQKTNLGTLGGASTRAVAINNSNQIVGTSQTTSGTWNAFIYSNGAMHDLGNFGFNGATGSSINNNGTYAINAYQPRDNGTSFICNGATCENVQPTNSYWSTVSHINDSGYAVGGIGTAGYGSYQAAFWQPGSYSTPTVNGMFNSFATSINNKNQVIGWGNGYSNLAAIYYSSPSAPEQDTGVYFGGNGNWSSASAINDLGTFIGLSYVTNGARHSFISYGGETYDLTSFFGFQVEDSNSNQLNQGNMMVGTIQTEWGFQAAILVPDSVPAITAAVPEPETYALMLAGLGLVGFMARRRKAK